MNHFLHMKVHMKVQLKVHVRVHEGWEPSSLFLVALFKLVLLILLLAQEGNLEGVQQRGKRPHQRLHHLLRLLPSPYRL